MCPIQCSHGAVSGIYETGQALIDAGVIPGSDITPEAALTKLSYVLSKDNWDHVMKRRAMEFCIRGEMTAMLENVNPATQEIMDNKKHRLELIEEVVKAMNLTTGEEMDNLKSVLFPSLLCSVASIGDIDKLKCLETYEADWNVGDYTGRTALHTAAISGNVLVVRWLLERGASVHVRDVNNETPLVSAVRSGHMPVVRTLSQCGAHLDLTPAQVADMMVGGAGAGKLDTLHCLLVAGADQDIGLTASGNTPLHAATKGDQVEVARLLLDYNADTGLCSKYGLTPLDIAHTLGRHSFLHHQQG